MEILDRITVRRNDGKIGVDKVGSSSTRRGIVLQYHH